MLMAWEMPHIPNTCSLHACMVCCTGIYIVSGYISMAHYFYYGKVSLYYRYMVANNVAPHPADVVPT